MKPPYLGNLFERQPPYRHDRCKTCGGVVEYRRTPDVFEDTWACATPGCPVQGTVSWSRVFGPRALEVAAS
jgi:hypothetical protein